MTDTATAGPTLERSVLERKERNELATIARALGVKPGPRAGKALIIDQILREAGIGSTPDQTTPSKSVLDTSASVGSSPVESSPVQSPEKTKRGRPRKAESGGVSERDDAGDVIAEVSVDAASLDPVSLDIASLDPRPGDLQPNGSAEQLSGRRAFGGRRPVGGATLFDPFAEAAASVSAPLAREEVDLEDIVTARDSIEVAREPREVGQRPSSGRHEGRADDGRDRRPEGGRSVGSRFDGSREGGRGDGGRGDQGLRGEGRPETPRDGQQPDGQQRDGQQRDGQQRDGVRNDGGRPGGFNRDRQDQRGDRNEQRGERPQNRPFQDRSNTSFDGEDGKNRRRRRRGRERDRVSPERDAQADRISETYQGELIEIEGLLDIADQGYGYIRAAGYLPSPRDVYVPVNKVRQLGLRKGDKVAGAHRPATPQEKFPAIVRIDTVNALHPEVARLRPKFEELTPLFPDERLRLEMPGDPGNMVARIVELVSPIGKGQRGLIVSPPKAGKTTIMKQIAHSIEANNPEVHLMVLLVDERPEEVTDMRRSVKGEVVASTFDRPADEHTLVAELAIERAKRLVEEGRHVVIILDGITRLARAYNLAAPATGRIMSGGIDTGALYPPKKFFGAARNVEEGGSLTILATALIETGSTMDTVIFEEFKGTGNMELRLDRRLAEKRIYPAINVNESSTRREDLLYDKRSLEAIWKLRRVLNGMSEGGSAAAALELLMDRIKTTRSNSEFLAEIMKAPSVGG